MSKQTQDSAVSYDELATAFLSAREGEKYSSRTIDSYEYAIKRFREFLDTFDLEYADIDAETNIAVDLDSFDHPASRLDDRNLIDYFILWLRDDAEYAESTAKTTYNALRPFIQFLESEGYIDYNPLHTIKPSKYLTYDKTRQGDEIDLETKAVTPEEHEQMLENVPEPRFRNRLMLSILWECGLRRKELAQLDTDDIYLQERRIHVPAVKWRRSHDPERRDVYFSESLKTNLNIWKNVKRKTYSGHDDSDALFLADHGPNKGRIVPDRVNKVVKLAAENAGVQEDLYQDKNDETRHRITAHSYRHAFAFESLAGEDREGGMDIWALAQAMGHSAVEVTEKYLDDGGTYIQNQMDEHSPTSPSI